MFHIIMTLKENNHNQHYDFHRQSVTNTQESQELNNQRILWDEIVAWSRTKLELPLACKHKMNQCFRTRYKKKQPKSAITKLPHSQRF
uniref:Uncharacterized protein n=1 Tax=Nelumbo nucifera TaxID=4432 RepID=A0A822ZP56_NELNU|nr:TPA_asm: hypothetical protein HUJ06_016624 [Nelumbo nucifera]